MALSGYPTNGPMGNAQSQIWRTCSSDIGSWSYEPLLFAGAGSSFWQCDKMRDVSKYMAQICLCMGTYRDKRNGHGFCQERIRKETISNTQHKPQQQQKLRIMATLRLGATCAYKRKEIHLPIAGGSFNCIRLLPKPSDTAL